MAAHATAPIRVGFVLHVMQVAGAEVLVAETIRRLGDRIRPTVFCLDAVGALGERLRGEGVDVVSFDRRPGLDLRVACRMGCAIRAGGLDVLHAHQYTPFFYGALAARLSRVRPCVIFTEHGRHYPDVVSAKRRLVNRLVFDRLADHINAVCEFSARSLRERDGFGGRATIEVIENGVDVSRYHNPADKVRARAAVGLPAGRRYVVNVARFHPVKDHRALVLAFAEVAPALLDVDLVLVGDGPLRSDIEQLVASHALAGRVHLLGVRDDVPDVLAACDVFALTSVSEAASITLLEAMVSGLPVVVTSVGGNPEIVRDGIEGYLAARGDVHGIAVAMRRLLDDPDEARAMGAAGADRVRRKYRLERTIDRYYELYAGSPADRQVA